MEVSAPTTRARRDCPGCQRSIGLTSGGVFALHYSYASGIGGQCLASGRRPGSALRAVCLVCDSEVETNNAGRANFHRNPEATTGCLGTGKLPELIP